MSGQGEELREANDHQFDLSLLRNFFEAIALPTASHFIAETSCGFRFFNIEFENTHFILHFSIRTILRKFSN